MTQECTKCDRPLDDTKIVWLELNGRTGIYYRSADEEVPARETQGEFPFGEACAQRVLKNGGRLDRTD